jgi:hypothetical protein
MSPLISLPHCDARGQSKYGYTKLCLQGATSSAQLLSTFLQPPHSHCDNIKQACTCLLSTWYMLGTGYSAHVIDLPTWMALLNTTGIPSCKWGTGGSERLREAL